MKLQHAWSKATPAFDEDRLVSHAGLVPLMALAEQAGLSELLTDRVKITSSLVRSAGVNPAGKITTIIAGMAAGADSIDDLDVVRSGGMKELFDGVYAPATLGQFLRSFTHGHASQLASVARAHLVGLVKQSDLLDQIEDQAFIDIDSLLRPVYGHAKQGASYGHAKIAGRALLRKGLPPLVTTISTRVSSAPVVSGVRLRAGKAGSGKAAASMVSEAIRTARTCGATGKILVRGDSIAARPWSSYSGDKRAPRSWSRPESNSAKQISPTVTRPANVKVAPGSQRTPMCTVAVSESHSWQRFICPVSPSHVTGSNPWYAPFGQVRVTGIESLLDVFALDRPG